MTIIHGDRESKEEYPQAMKLFALLPAAGQSSRMGRPKLALPLGGRTVLEHVVRAFHGAGVDEVFVVLGPASAALAPLAGTAGARVLSLEHDTPDMRATVLCGLDWLEQLLHPDDADAFFLVPADHPTLDPNVIRELAQAAAGSSGPSIWIPTHGGKRGHPALIAWRHVPGLRSVPEGQGLNVYLRSQREQTQEIPSTSPEILCDLDTPDDYARLLRAWPAGSAVDRTSQNVDE